MMVRQWIIKPFKQERILTLLPNAAPAVQPSCNPTEAFQPLCLVLGYVTGGISSVDNFSFNPNKWIPPGAKFRYRLRARFSNCSDRYTDAEKTTYTSEDYLDYDYNGAEPYKIINFDFGVYD
jgi:hypothetical protein